MPNDLLIISQILSNICGAVVPLIAVFLARRELTKWRSELIGKNRIELAQRIGRVTVQFRNAFFHIVSAPIYKEEYSDRPVDDDEHYQLTKILNEAFARKKRLGQAHRLLNEMEELSTEAEIIFPTELEEFIDPCKKAVAEMEKLIDAYTISGGGSSFGSTDENFVQIIMDEAQKFNAILDGKDRTLLLYFLLNRAAGRWRHRRREALASTSDRRAHRVDAFG